MCKLVSVFVSFRKWQSRYRTWRKAWVSWRRTKHCALFCPHYSLSAISLMDQMWVMAMLMAFSPSALLFFCLRTGKNAKEVINDWKHIYSKSLNVAREQRKSNSCHVIWDISHFYFVWVFSTTRLTQVQASDFLYFTTFDWDSAIYKSTKHSCEHAYEQTTDPPCFSKHSVLLLNGTDGNLLSCSRIMSVNCGNGLWLKTLL